MIRGLGNEPNCTRTGGTHPTVTRSEQTVFPPFYFSYIYLPSCLHSLVPLSDTNTATTQRRRSPKGAAKPGDEAHLKHERVSCCTSCALCLAPQLESASRSAPLSVAAMRTAVPCFAAALGLGLAWATIRMGDPAAVPYQTSESLLEGPTQWSWRKPRALRRPQPQAPLPCSRGWSLEARTKKVHPEQGDTPRAPRALRQLPPRRPLRHGETRTRRRAGPQIRPRHPQHPQRPRPLHRREPRPLRQLPPQRELQHGVANKTGSAERLRPTRGPRALRHHPQGRVLPHGKARARQVSKQREHTQQARPLRQPPRRRTPVLNITMSAGIPSNRTGETYIQNRLSRHRQQQQQGHGSPAMPPTALPNSGIKAPPQAPGRLSPARYKAPPHAQASTATSEPPVKQPPARPNRPAEQRPPVDPQPRKAPHPKPPPAHLVPEETQQQGRPTAAAGSHPQDQPREEPPKPRQPPPADFSHSQPTALYRQVFGYDRNPLATPTATTATAGGPTQEAITEPEEPPDAAAAESPQQATDDAWERLRASLQHLDADPIVGTKQEQQPSLEPQQQHDDQPQHQQQQQRPPAEESPQQPRAQAPAADEQAIAAAASSRARSASTQGRGAQAPPQQAGHLPPLEPWSRKRRPWQPFPRQIPQGQHDFHDRTEQPEPDQPATGAASSQQPVAQGPDHEAQPDTQQHANRTATGQPLGGPSTQRPPQHQQKQPEHETAETAPAAHTDQDTGADPTREQREHSHAASGETPPDRRQQPRSGTAPATPQPEPQAEQAAPTHHEEHGSAPSGDTQNNLQQRQERQHPPPAGYHQTAAASSSSETGTPSSAAQQWGRYTPGAGDQRTRNKADKTWIHAEFAKRGWKKPPHLTWRQVECRAKSRESAGSKSSNDKPQPSPTSQGALPQLLNLHLLPRNPPQGTSQQTEPSDPTAASSTQAPRQPQQGTQEQTAAPQQEDPTSKRATWAQQQAEERAQHPVPQAAAAGTRPQPSQPTWEGDAPIQVRTPPNEDPTSKEGTRAQERAQQRQQPARQANRTQQGSERARQGPGTRPATRGPGSVLPHQHPTGSTRVAATSTARAHRRSTEAVHVPPNFAQVTWLDSGVPPTFPPSLPVTTTSGL